eukprot:m.52849 g.52849  ORF g.52849 m.52849 type:complete len:90 (-) comp10823_c0_seq2:57-326(-)
MSKAPLSSSNRADLISSVIGAAVVSAINRNSTKGIANKLKFEIGVVDMIVCFFFSIIFVFLDLYLYCVFFQLSSSFFLFLQLAVVVMCG